MNFQSGPVDLHVLRDRFTDLDQQAAQLSGYDQIYRQLSRGSFAGSFTTIEGKCGAGLYVEKVNQVIEQLSSVPRDQTSLVFLCGDQTPARFGTKAFEPETAMLLGPGAEIDFQSAVGTHVCVITLGSEALRQAGDHSDMRIPAGGETREIRQPAATGSLVQAMQAILQVSLLAAGFAGEPFDGDGFTEEISAIMLAMTGLAGAVLGTRLLPLHVRAELFRKARCAIHDTLDIVSVARLQKQLGISRRTLEYAFHEATGMSPRAYIAAVRLDTIRRTIKTSGDSIGDIAARNGVWHLGRFASQYRNAFGELPSQTRR